MSAIPFVASRHGRALRTLNGLLCGIALAMAVASCTEVQAQDDAGPANTAPPGSLTVRANQPGVQISPTLYGLMTEEINYSYDGGLYAELIRNRIFKDNAQRPVHWTTVNNAQISLDRTNPVPANAKVLDTALRVELTGGAKAGVANEGYWGIPVKPNNSYRASFWARGSNGLAGPLMISIEDASGKAAASAQLPAISGQWEKYSITLRTGPLVQPSTTNRFVISSTSKGTLNLNLVSLFPPTYNNHPNGNRVDLMEKLAAMKPSFLRFPGGNYLEGNTIAERFNWKETIGPLEDRPGHMCPWGYRSSDGMGLLEFLTWCEDLKMEPVLGVFAGYALRGERVLGEALKPHVQDALDEIEYVSGDANTTWGARRAKDGHPAPFKLTYVEIGNEDFFDNQPGSYDQRYAAFHDAIKAKYPQLKLIATTPVRSRTPDVVDDHYYRSARDFQNDVNHYDPDKSPRTGPKIFVGEWATTEGSPTPTTNAALGDGAWLTGMERNSDKIILSAYAPLLVNVNPGGRQWATNLIGYDALHSFVSPAYHVQQMFYTNKGDVVLPVELKPQEVPPPPPAPTPHGGIGVGTWSTQAEYKDMRVTKDGQLIWQADLTKSLDSWKANQGDWKVVDGALRQSSNETNCHIITGDPTWTDYTVEMKGRKLGGQEGLMVLVDARDNDNWVWWNIGGWTNTRTALERSENGAKAELGQPVEMKVENNRWYDIKIETKGRSIKCYLDGKLITEATNEPLPPGGGVFATSSRDKASGDVIVKVVNAYPSSQRLQVNVQGLTQVSEATAIVLAGEPDDVNSIAEPNKVAPKTVRLRNASPSFDHTFPAHSVTVLRLKGK